MEFTLPWRTYNVTNRKLAFKNEITCKRICKCVRQLGYKPQATIRPLLLGKPLLLLSFFVFLSPNHVNPLAFYLSLLFLMFISLSVHAITNPSRNVFFLAHSSTSFSSLSVCLSTYIISLPVFLYQSTNLS